MRLKQQCNAKGRSGRHNECYCWIFSGISKGTWSWRPTRTTARTCTCTCTLWRGRAWSGSPSGATPVSGQQLAENMRSVLFPWSVIPDCAMFQPARRWRPPAPTSATGWAAAPPPAPSPRPDPAHPNSQLVIGIYKFGEQIKIQLKKFSNTV